MFPGEISRQWPVERSAPTLEVIRINLRLRERLQFPSVRPGAQVTLWRRQMTLKKSSRTNSHIYKFVAWCYLAISINGLSIHRKQFQLMVNRSGLTTVHYVHWRRRKASSFLLT